MSVDSKPRDFCYLTHKNNFPLELVGNMKRKVGHNTPLNSNINSSNIKQEMADKIINNYLELKSIIPVQLSPPNRKQSIKTFSKDRNLNVSGAAYLMIKSKIGSNHPQKRHLSDNNYPHSLEEQTHGQRRHFNSHNKEVTEKPISRPSEAFYKKINDIYSWAEGKQNDVAKTVKISKTNLFTEGEILGYEEFKKRSISCAKKREMAGTYWAAPQQNCRARREDWRKSSINFG